MTGGCRSNAPSSGRSTAAWGHSGSGPSGAGGGSSGSGQAGGGGRNSGPGQATSGGSRGMRTVPDNGESSGAAVGLSKTYVVTAAGRQVELKGTITDPWSHGIKRGKIGWRCGYCSTSQQSGGATRLREHLCGLQGNVQPCLNVPRNVKDILLEQVAIKKRKKRDTRESRLYIQKALVEHDYRTAIASLNEEQQYNLAVRESLKDIGLTDDGRARHSSVVIGTGTATASSTGSKSCSSNKQSSLHSFYPGSGSSKAPFDIDLARSMSPSQPRVDIMLGGESKLRLWKAISKFFHANDMPGIKADCPYFTAAFKLAQQLGDLPLPKGKDIDGPLLDMNYNDMEAHMESFKEDWGRYGVTIMCDSWTGPTMMCIINFMIFCNGRMFFHKSVNATGKVQNAEYLYDCIRTVVVDEVGAKFVIQIVTDNGSNYKKACKKLTAEHPHITWQPCAAHTINLMLKDIGKFDDVACVVNSAKRICRFFYNHNRLHAMMREKIGGELIRWNATRFGTVYLCLQSFWDRQDKLQAWMVSAEWKNSDWRNEEDHAFAYDCLISRAWWDKVELVLNAVGPIFFVLRFADGQKNATLSGFLPKMIQAYNDICAKLKKAERGKGDLLNKTAEVISTRIRYLLNETLVLAAAALDPQELYRSNLAKKPCCQLAVTLAIKKLATSTAEAAAAIDQFPRFIEKKGLFGDPEARWSALNGKNSAAEWWGSYGGQCPELQRLARRIVSQCISSSGCERNWSTFALVHTKLRNKLGFEKLHKLVKVHYNLKLQIQQFQTDFQSLQLQEKDDDPCSMMMDVALYDEQNPVMDWLCNSMSGSTPTLDEYDDDDLDWSMPSSFVVDKLQMDIEEVAAFKRTFCYGKKGSKRKQIMQWDEEEEEDTAEDSDSSQEQGSPIYAESGDSSSSDEGDDNNDAAGDGSGGARATVGASNASDSGSRHGEPTLLRPRSTRKRKPTLKSINEL